MSQCCGECISFAPARGPTGKPCPSKEGRCTFEVKWPLFPSSMQGQNLPGKCLVCRYNGGECPVFVAKRKAKVKVSPVEHPTLGLPDSAPTGQR